MLLLLVGRRQNGGNLATTSIVLMDPRLQLVQRDELFLLVFPARGGLVEEVSVALRHILGDHLLLGPPLEAQQVLQLLSLLPIPFYLRLFAGVTAAMILLALLGLAKGRGGGVHAGAIADHHRDIVPHDTTAVRQ